MAVFFYGRSGVVGPAPPLVPDLSWHPLRWIADYMVRREH